MPVHSDSAGISSKFAELNFLRLCDMSTRVLLSLISLTFHSIYHSLAAECSDYGEYLIRLVHLLTKYLATPTPLTHVCLNWRWEFDFPRSSSVSLKELFDSGVSGFEKRVTASKISNSTLTQNPLSTWTWPTCCVIWLNVSLYLMYSTWQWLQLWGGGYITPRS